VGKRFSAAASIDAKPTSARPFAASSVLGCTGRGRRISSSCGSKSTSFDSTTAAEPITKNVIQWNAIEQKNGSMLAKAIPPSIAPRPA